MNAGSIGRGFVQQFKCAGEGQVGVRDAEGGGGDGFKRRFDQDSRSLRDAGQRGVFGVGDEGELPGGGVFEAGSGVNLQVRIAVEGGAEMVGESC